MPRQLLDAMQPNLDHLEAELVCLDLRLRRQVLRWQQAGQDATDPYRGLYITPDQAAALLDRPPASHWGAQVVENEGCSAELADLLTAEHAAIRRCRNLEAEARNRRTALRLDHLANAFDLCDLDRAILLMALAAALDLRYGQVFAFLQDDVTRKQPSINLALDLLAPPGIARLGLLPHFAADAPLFRYGLLRHTAELPAGCPDLTATFVCDPVVAAWLLGHYRVESAASNWLRLLVTTDPEQDDPEQDDLGQDGPGVRDLSMLARAPADPATGAALERAAQPGPGFLVVLDGPDPLAQEVAAARVARQLGQPLLIADLDGAPPAGQPPQALVQRTLRDARLLNAVAFLRLPSSGSTTAGATDPGTPDPVPPAWQYLLEQHPGPLFLAEAEPLPWQPRRVLTAFHIAPPNAAQRVALWQHCLGAQCAAAVTGADITGADITDADIAGVAERYPLRTAQICAAARAAVNQAAQAQATVHVRHLYAAARRHAAANLSGLAHKLPAAAAWSDLVLPPLCLRQLREICGQLQHRALVHEHWGFAARLTLGKGLAVLFAGPSGAGKTMAAGVLAGELGFDLYRIDLSSVVSKYIGETEKNLSRIFDAAESGSVILFFDEADALFGKRSAVRDAHDRYANVETSYLLQRLEEYNGLAILATNLRQNMDDAFVRRLHYIVEFPPPAVAERRRIWAQIWPAATPRDADLDLDFLAERMEITGGVIRNAALGAAFLAAANGGVVNMAHVIAAIQAEYRKMGRILVEQDLGPYAHYLQAALRVDA